MTKPVVGKEEGWDATALSPCAVIEFNVQFTPAPLQNTVPMTEESVEGRTRFSRSVEGPRERTKRFPFSTEQFWMESRLFAFRIEVVEPSLPHSGR